MLTASRLHPGGVSTQGQIPSATCRSGALKLCLEAPNGQLRARDVPLDEKEPGVFSTCEGFGPLFLDDQVQVRLVLVLVLGHVSRFETGRDGLLPTTRCKHSLRSTVRSTRQSWVV